jgi:cation diffusion facilitator CzcD-associated flavoprotein CzcO
MSNFKDGADSVSRDVDIVIIGAGVAGINAAQRVQTELPGFTYTVLEARGAMGGTWSLFNYPGIRSDSDLYTFGFSWRPWSGSQAIADGPAIKKYLAESAAEYGIDKRILYNHKLIAANWSSKTQSWSLTIDAAGEKQSRKAKFIIYGSGYYDYDEPLKTTIPGINHFKGNVIHPQFWPKDFDYDGKKIIIVGSGATAITLLPVLAKTAASVTMLQRSPTYILSQPSLDTATWIRRIFPSWIAHSLVRWKYMWGMFLYFQFCRAFPKLAKKQIKADTVKQLPKNVAYDPNFTPKYNPWEQRLCVCPDGDFYKALSGSRSKVVTDTIQTVTETGILTTGGTTLDADVIITATGLKMRFAGGARISVDDTPINLADKILWRGALIQDVPNSAFLLGYTNASWTLGTEASSQLVCRIIRHMKANGFSAVTPKVDPKSNMKVRGQMNLKSTYVKAGLDVTPKAGDSGPWKARTAYFKDYWNSRFGDITTDLEYTKSFL